jgi:hypothetical protein
MDEAIESFWKTYNSDDSWLPLFLPSSLWFSCWLYCRSQGRDYSRWYNLHSLHHLGAISMGLLSMYLNDDSKFNERIVILWSMPYFMLDILDCTLMGHFTYVLHGIICLGLGLCNYNIPLLRELRMNSKASMIESSTVLLHQVKQNRDPVLFCIFALVYTLCRIVWIPFMMKELYDNGLKVYDVIFLALIIFYCLQIRWWIKIIKIMIQGPDVDDKENSKSKKL